MSQAAVPLRVVGLYALIPALAAVLGAAVAAARPPRAHVRSKIQHLAAGVVFAVVAGELLPELRELHAVGDVAAGFGLGVLVMVGIRMGTERLPAAGRLGTLVPIGIDFALDGLLVGLGFAAGDDVGRLLVIALTIELVALGLALAAEEGSDARTRWRAVGTTAALAVLLVVGALGGATAFSDLSGPRLADVLAFGSAALLYLVTEELLVEAHEVPETPWSTAMFFVGFGTLFVLDLLL